MTALEGSIVPAPDQVPSAEEQVTFKQQADDYLQSVVPLKAPKQVPEWLDAIAPEVVRMSDWCRCVAYASRDTEAGRLRQREGVTIMLQAAVTSTSLEDQGEIVDRMHEWAQHWRDQESKLADAMQV
jgi:hypothetical protein